MNARKILLIEDNEGDILLITEAFSETKIDASITVVKDGNEAIVYLDKLSKTKPRIYPDLIFLDINLPKKNGHEILTFIKSNITLKSIPVIVLTTSSSEKDIAKAYAEYANSYIVKPIDINDFLKVISSIDEFWFKTVQLPE